MVVQNLERFSNLNLGEYVNQYVALDDKDGVAVVVAFGDRIHHVHEEAVKRGIAEPVVTFIPPSDMLCSY